MGFFGEVKKGWKGYSSVEPSPILASALIDSAVKDINFHKIRYVAGLASTVLGSEDKNLLMAVYGTYVEGRKLTEMIVCPAILCLLPNRIILCRHSNPSTTKRIIDTVEIPLDKVSSIWIGMVGFGGSEITIETSTESIKFRHTIDILEKIKAAVNSQMNNTSKHSAINETAQDLTTKLMELGQLFDTGVLNKEEFEAAKKKILGL